VRHLYNTLAMLAWLMQITCPDNHWKSRLLALLKAHHVNPHAMGMPGGFESLPLWQVSGEASS